MQTNLDCIPCIVNSFIRLLKTGDLTDIKKEQALRRLLSFIAEMDYKKSPPVLGREMHRMMREELNDHDPYHEIKNKYNRMMLDMYSEFEEMVNNSNNSFDMAMRLAIAGNVIDFGPQDEFNIMDTINRVILSKIAIDDSKSLKNDLSEANSLLYIGDNCGEIVLDKLFLETINIPNKIFAVRGSPVLNDSTFDDAITVGIDKIATVITTGDNAPGVVLESTSDEFKKIFSSSDIIISKGQGNLEGLIGQQENIYYLLVAKCQLVGNILGAEKGDFIVKKNPSLINEEKISEMKNEVQLIDEQNI